MKQIYIPTQEELSCLKNAGGNTYKYILTKTIESVIMADVIYEEEDMFDVAYDKFSEYPEIIWAIAKLYPEKISEHDRAMNDTNLCMQIIPTLKQPDRRIYGLDMMTQFSDTVLQNPDVIKETINTLSVGLQDNPRYRFEYLGPNPVLDDLFACETNIDVISQDILDSITYIEPAYYAKLEEMLLKNAKESRNVYSLIIRSALRYSFRYGIKQSSFKPDVEKAKKLYRHLQEHKKNYQF